MPDSPRVVVTRRAEQAASFCDQLRGAGFRPILFPTIQLQQLPAIELDAALAEIERFSWLIFSSSNAVDFFFQRVKVLGTGRASAPNGRCRTGHGTKPEKGANRA